jgi:RHS repeat-associated protein
MLHGKNLPPFTGAVFVNSLQVLDSLQENPLTYGESVSATFNLRYPGQYFDKESGLSYNYFRSYDSRTGRYTQSDPIDLAGGWNKFSYAEGDPLGYTDPDGLAKLYRNPADLMPLDGGGGGGGGLGGGSRPPSYTPPGAGRGGAFNTAKELNGVPKSQQPVATRPNTDSRGNPQPGRQYDFDIPKPGGGTNRVTFRDDSAGHFFGPGNSQNRGPHFNDMCSRHFDY